MEEYEVGLRAHLNLTSNNKQTEINLRAGQLSGPFSFTAPYRSRADFDQPGPNRPEVARHLIVEYLWEKKEQASLILDHVQKIL
jgi:hypothetical protein